MQRHKVESDDLKTLGYNKETQIMEIEFKDGQIYQYADVPELLYLSLKATKLKGPFFHKHVRGKFITTQVTPDQPELKGEPE